MQVTSRVKVDFVQYRGDGPVLINVEPQLVDADGAVVGRMPVQNVHTTEDALTAFSTARGETIWDNADVDAAIREAQELDASTPIVWQE